MLTTVWDLSFMAARKVSQYLTQYKVDTTFCLENLYTVQWCFNLIIFVLSAVVVCFSRKPSLSVDLAIHISYVISFLKVVFCFSSCDCRQVLRSSQPLCARKVLEWKLGKYQTLPSRLPHFGVPVQRHICPGLDRPKYRWQFITL